MADSKTIPPAQSELHTGLPPVCPNPEECCRALSRVWEALGWTDYKGKAVWERVAELKAQHIELRAACHAFCSTLAFTPSTIPGAIEADLNTAYNLARAALKKIDLAKAEGKDPA